MPFIRYARDKQGYESTFVMHAYRGANGASRTRVLYFFRSPSSTRVGRRPLEAEVMEALEHTHPDLAFDWQSLLREPTLPRIDPRDFRARPQRTRSGPRREPSRPGPAAPPKAEPVQVVLEDETLLGRTVGARDAARLRQRYTELTQRVVRRARTPEERDRLIDRLHRLNPDEWPDQAAIQAAVATIDAGWEAIAGELPHRRRGRRGGRHRNEGSAPSGIISGDSARGEQNDDDGQSLDFSGPGDGSGVGPDADTEPTQPADPPGPEPADAAPPETGPDGPGVPRGDGHDPY